MFDFETIYQKHGENFIWGVLEIWERDNRVCHAHTMTLEDRWERFIKATNDNLFPSPAAAAATYH